jgi:hypothetical protein
VLPGQLASRSNKPALLIYATFRVASDFPYLLFQTRYVPISFIAQAVHHPTDSDHRESVVTTGFAKEECGERPPDLPDTECRSVQNPGHIQLFRRAASADRASNSRAYYTHMRGRSTLNRRKNRFRSKTQEIPRRSQAREKFPMNQAAFESHRRPTQIKSLSDANPNPSLHRLNPALVRIRQWFESHHKPSRINSGKISCGVSIFC